MDDIVILASMVEKEAGAEDFAKVAAVFYNRLKAGMTLSSDATVKYVTGVTRLALTESDTAVASPYNTWDRAADMAGRPDLPKTFFSCGTEDPLMYRRFRDFRDHAKAVGLDAEFTEREGYGHEWAFWDLEIRRALDLFLPEER